MLRRARRHVGWMVAALALCCAAGCTRPPPDVIIIVVDTLRADRLGAGGGRPGLTPFIDSLAASGVVFSNAYSPTSWTNPAVASLFTSRYPSQHHLSNFDSVLADDELTLAERLRDAGYRGMGISANFRLLARLGFDQGFDAWAALVAPSLSTPKVSAKRVEQVAFRYYDRFFAPYRYTRWARRRRPMLLYFQFLEPHAPYDPPMHLRRRIAGAPPPGVSDAEINAKLLDRLRWRELSPPEVARLRVLYDAEVAELDRRLGRIFEGFRSRGLLDRAIIVFTADHGEELREHGRFQHGNTLYQESVRIPLFIAGPGLPAGRVVTDQVSLVDVAPTVLELLGLPPEPRFEGRSLLRHLGGAEPADVVLQLLPTGDPIDVHAHVGGLVHDGVKLLVPPEEAGRSPELYDLRDDPGETRSDPPPAIAEQTPALEARLKARDDEFAARAGKVQRGSLSEDERDRLRALGYAD